MKHRVILPIVTALAAGLAGWVALGHQHLHAGAPPPSPPAVPVTAQGAQRRDIPVYLHGLGTVQAFNIAEIKAQANGMLISVPVHEGQKVRQGDIVALIDPRPYQAALGQATAQKAEDEAQLKGAQLDLQRFQQLATRNFAPIQQVDDQQATVDKLNAAVEADTAAIETARINLGFCTVRAPINGRVSLFQTDVGNLIEVASQTTGIVSITQDQPISVVFTLPESDLPRIQDAMRGGTLPVQVYTSDDKTKLSDGTLLTPNNAIDTSTGTISLKATFANNDDRLWPGQFVNAHLLVGMFHNAVTVPLTAVVHGPDGLFVYTIQVDHTVRQQPVNVGYQGGGTAVITEGMHGGTQVVVAGQARLSPGMRVATRNAAPSGQSDADTGQGASGSTANG
jgi:membrane fusion protein, multidrug efflux system